MLYIDNDKKEIVYFSETQNRAIVTKNPNSISKKDFFSLTKEEMIELLKLQINGEQE